MPRALLLRVRLNSSKISTNFFRKRTLLQMSAGVPHFDVLIIGAGLSGVGAARHLQLNCPSKSFLLLEARAANWNLGSFDTREFAPTATCTPWATISNLGRPLLMVPPFSSTSRRRHLGGCVSESPPSAQGNMVHRGCDGDYWSENRYQSTSGVHCWILNSLRYYLPASYCRAGQQDSRGDGPPSGLWNFDYTGKRIIVIGRASNDFGSSLESTG